MALYLVQHGKCFSKDEDPEQGLTPGGIETVTRIAATAQNNGISVHRILHSEKKRAEQTADILSEKLSPPAGMEKRTGLKPMDDVAAFAATINVSENIMTVGHLPFMERLTSYLILGKSEPTVIKFQNGGIVCLDRHSAREGWIIKWTLMPDIQ